MPVFVGVAEHMGILHFTGKGVKKCQTIICFISYILNCSTYNSLQIETRKKKNDDELHYFLELLSNK